MARYNRQNEVGEHRRVNPKVLRELSRGPRDLGCTLCHHRRRKEGEQRIKRGNRRMGEKREEKALGRRRNRKVGR